MSTELIDLVNEEETCLADMSYFFLIGLLVKVDAWVLFVLVLSQQNRKYK